MKISILFAGVFLSLALASSAFAQAGQWALALRAGPSFATQKLGTFTLVEPVDLGVTPARLDLRTGPMVSGKISYGLNDYFSLGLNVEWDSHKIPTKTFVVDSFGETFEMEGRFHTVSLMPFVEVRPVKLGDFSPYLAVALGTNLNWIGVTHSTTPGKVFTADADNTFGVKVGGGFDYFITKALAFNTEAGWKYNRGQLRIAGTDTFPDVVGSKGHFKADAVSLLFGLRYYFSK